MGLIKNYKIPGQHFNKPPKIDTFDINRQVKELNQISVNDFYRTDQVFQTSNQKMRNHSFTLNNFSGSRTNTIDLFTVTDELILITDVILSSRIRGDITLMRNTLYFYRGTVCVWKASLQYNNSYALKPFLALKKGDLCKVAETVTQAINVFGQTTITINYVVLR